MAEALPTVVFEVSGKKYETDMLPATEGRILSLRLIKAMVPALEHIEFKKDLKPEEKEKAFVDAAVSVIANLDDELLDMLCDKLGDRTRHVVDSTHKPKMDKSFFALHFAGRYFEMYTWLFEVCKANGFLGFLLAS